MSLIVKEVSILLLEFLGKVEPKPWPVYRQVQGVKVRAKQLPSGDYIVAHAGGETEVLPEFFEQWFEPCPEPERPW